MFIELGIGYLVARALNEDLKGSELLDKVRNAVANKPEATKSPMSDEELKRLAALIKES